MVYNYSFFERIIMAITTSISNISTVPGLYLMKYQGRIYSYYFSYFGIFVSFMYHLCESLDIVIFIPQLQWHELDNIAAIYCMNNLLLTFTKFGFDINYIEKMNYLSTFLILVFQKKGPWELINTIMPVLICLVYVVYHLLKNGMPKYYKNTLTRGLVFFAIALIFFVRGLDDLNDYIRMYHSLWHIFVGIAFYYLFQIQVKDYVSFKQITNYTLQELGLSSSKRI